MSTQEAKAHRIGEWASLRNTSPEIAGAIFEVAHYDEKLAEEIWEEGSDEVFTKAFEKVDKDSSFWGEQTIERRNVQRVDFPVNTGEFPFTQPPYSACY